MKKFQCTICVFLSVFLFFPAMYGEQNTRRDQQDKPEILMDIAGVKPGMLIGEAGAGRGYLTFFLSRRVGAEGLIYANDIDEQALQALERRCKREGVNNIEVVLGEVTDPNFPVNDLDMIVMLYAFHDFTEKEAWLENVKKYMKQDASLIIFDGQNTHTGMSEELVSRVGKSAGFELVQYTSLHNGIWAYILKISDNNQNFPKLTGPYLGQTPPGTTPEIFAPGIICTEASEGSSGFALNGTVFLFQRFIDRQCHTYMMTRTGDVWSQPSLIPFWEQLIHNGDFVIALDDRTLLYQVKQELSGRLESNIWEVQLTEGGWGQRAPLPSPINTSFDESFATRSSNGNLYFFSRRPGGVGASDLYMSEYRNGRYGDPVNLKELNTTDHEWDPYIAPDEQYLIFCSTRPGGMGEDDFYISFRDKNNRWRAPVHLDDRFNSPQSENRPYVTHDGRFFFFTSSRRGNRDIYWVDAKIIEDLKPQN